MTLNWAHRPETDRPARGVSYRRKSKSRATLLGANPTRRGRQCLRELQRASRGARRAGEDWGCLIPPGRWPHVGDGSVRRRRASDERPVLSGNSEAWRRAEVHVGLPVPSAGGGVLGRPRGREHLGATFRRRAESRFGDARAGSPLAVRHRTPIRGHGGSQDGPVRVRALPTGTRGRSVREPLGSRDVVRPDANWPSSARR
jgi:hypothetical protein